VEANPRQAYPDGCYGGTVPRWLAFLTAIPFAYVIWRLGVANLRALAGPAPGTLDEEKPPSEPEDVEALEVYLVCGECGTEYKVSRLGELQIPRHCGEKMQVVRRVAEA
jgi:hypothetical protein